MPSLRRVISVGLLSLVGVVTSALGQGACDPICRISTSRCGNGPGNSFLSGQHCLSEDGRHAVFHSEAADLVCGDTNGVSDVFLFDRITSSLARVSVTNDGSQLTTASIYASISRDGRFVAFDNRPAVYVRDLFAQPPTTTLVSVNDDGTGNGGGDASISGNGRFVAFVSSAPYNGSGNGSFQVYVHDRTTRFTARASVNRDGQIGNGACANPSISDDGSRVVFFSAASNLDTIPDPMRPGFRLHPDNNGHYDVYLRDIAAGETTLISRTLTGEAANNDSVAPTISGDGQYVFFYSQATNLVSEPDRNGSVEDVYRYEVATGIIRHASVDGAGLQGDGYSASHQTSADGSRIVFNSAATDLVLPNANGATPDILVRDMDPLYDTGSIHVMSAGANCSASNGGSAGGPSISADGEYVLLSSVASNLAGNPSGQYYEVYLARVSTCAPTISMHPSRIVNAVPRPYSPTVNVCPPGDTVLLQAAAIGTGPLSFMWYKLINGVWTSLDPVPPSLTGVFGATTPTLSLSLPSGNPNLHAGTYKVQVTNACECGLAESRTTTLSFNIAADLDDGSGTGTPDGGVTIDDLLYYLRIFEGDGCSP